MPLRKKTTMLLRAFMLCLVFSVSASIPAAAEGFEDYSAGTYDVTAALSCYVNAMGGIEFGAPLLSRAAVTIDENGAAAMTLYLTKSSVTIYGITCDTFVDPAPANPNSDRGVLSGTISCYDGNGVLMTEGVSYTLSSDTALNPASEPVNYVNSITFPLDRVDDKYYLSMYINSNVMGVQFCNSNAAATESTYPAVLTVGWSSAAAAVPAAAAVSETTAAAAPEAETAVISETTAAAAPETSAAVPETLAAGVSEDAVLESMEAALALQDSFESSGAGEGGHTSRLVTDEGLNIYYADQTEAEEGAAEAQANPEAAYYTLNMDMIKRLVVCAAILIVLGFILLFSSKYKIVKREAE